jgi:hypothetical protein
MKFPRLFLLSTFCLLPFAGCAKSPSGGATVAAPNRLEVTLTIDKTLDPNFYYGVAFDDEPGDGDGPRALDSNTVLLNGVMGGSWKVLVLFHQTLSNPIIYYRSDPDDPGSERRILGTSLLFSRPRVSSNAINFVLDLDAQVSSGTYFFDHTAGVTPTLATDRFDVNFVTTNRIIVGTGSSGGGSDQRVKPVDAYETASLSTSFEFQLASTRQISITDALNDKRLDIDPSFASVNFGQLDVRKLDLGVTRSR